MYRRFFTGPNAERDAKAHAKELNDKRGATGPVAGAPGKPGSKFGAGLGALLAAENALKAKQAAIAKAKADAAKKASVGQFVAMHQQNAIKVLDQLTSTSSRASVLEAVRQAEAAGLPQAQVEAVLKARGFDQGRLAGFANQLKAETARA
jgi:hypothetical protein